MRTISYNNGLDFRTVIKNIKNEFLAQRENIRFIVPSRDDKRLFPMNENENLTLWTWQEIYEDISRSGRRRVLSPPDHLLILRDILDEAAEKYCDKIEVLPGVKRPGFLQVLSSDIRELLNEAVDPEKLPFNPESNNPAEFLLPEIYAKYLKYLEDFSLLDSAQVYSEAHDEILRNQEWGKGLVIIFAGFLSFNHAQLQLVKAVNDRCYDTVIIKPEANMHGFHDALKQIRDDFMITVDTDSPACKSSGHIIEISSAEPGLEPEIIARTLALWHSGKWEKGGEFPGFDSIGLMIEDGRGEAFSEAFRRYGVPYDFMDGITINRTLPGKILSSLHTLSTRNFPTYDTAMILTQSCFAGSKFPVMRAYRAGYSGLEGWTKYLSERADDPDETLKGVFQRALISVEAIGKFCGAMNIKHNPAGIMNAFDSFLHTPGIWLNRDDDVSSFPELDESVRLTASAIQTVSEKSLSLNELMPDIGRVQDEKMSGDKSYEFLADWCRTSHVRAPIQLSDSVRIFTGTPPVLSSFKVWIMSGVTQKSWSPNEKASPLLGNEERSKLNENGAYLPRTKEKAEQKEALFRRLVMTGEYLTVISRPLLDDEGRPVSESPFMKRFLDDMPGWKNEPLNSEGINILLGSDGFTFSEIDAGEKITRITPCVSSRENSVGASDIQELIECPLLWYQRRRAKLYQPDSELVSPAEFGNMLHAYWESVWKIYRKDMAAKGINFVSIAKSEWENLINTDKDNETYGRFHLLVKDWRLKRRLEGIKFRALRLAAVQGEILDSLHKNYTHESILLEDEAHLMYELGGVKFFGQCDRIEILRGDDGKRLAFIADYKEGRMSAKSYDEGMKNLDAKFWHKEGELSEFKRGLQLSLYSAMFKEKHGYDVSGVYILGHEDGCVWGTFSGDTAGIFAGFTGKGNDGKNIKLDTDTSARVEEGKYAMKCAVKILEAGEFSPDYDSKRCRNCHITSICRKGEFRGEISEEDSD